MSSACNLESTLNEFQTASCETKIWDSLSKFIVSQSITAFVYHHLPALGAYDYLKKKSVKRSFDNEGDDVCSVIDFCFEHNLRSRARHMVDAEFWSSSSCTNDELKKELGTRLDWPPAEKDMRGVSIPVHGPSGRNGCFSLGFSDACNIKNINGLQNLRWACQNAHQSYCRYLNAEFLNSVVLTDRETEILQWMAIGKSNGVIADILDISHHTVSTYVRRIFLKTSTSDRTSASLYGISNGLIKL